MEQSQREHASFPKHKRKLKNLLIDRSFQLRYALFSVFVTVVLCTVLGTVVLWQSRAAHYLFVNQRNKTMDLFRRQRSETTHLLSRMRQAALADLEKVLRTASDMLDVQLKDKDPGVREAAKLAKQSLLQNDRKRIVRQKEEDLSLLFQRQKADREVLSMLGIHDKQLQSRHEKYQTLLFIFLGVFALVVVVLIFFFNIRMTHRVAGPLFKVGRYFDEITEGRLGNIGVLRKHDQLQDFYRRFKDMHDSLSARAQKEIDSLEGILKACKSEDSLDEVKKSLEKLLEEKKDYLGKEDKA